MVTCATCAAVAMPPCSVSRLVLARKRVIHRCSRLASLTHLEHGLPVDLLGTVQYLHVPRPVSVSFLLSLANPAPRDIYGTKERVLSKYYTAAPAPAIRARSTSPTDSLTAAPLLHPECCNLYFSPVLWVCTVWRLTVSGRHVEKLAQILIL